MLSPGPISPDVAAVVSALAGPTLLIGPDFTVVAASAAYLDLMGVAREAFVGKPVSQALADSDSLDALVSSLQAVVRTGRTHEMAPGLFLAAGGNAPRHQRLLQCVNTPVAVADEFWILHHAAEAEAHKDAATVDASNEAALRAAEARLRSIMRTVPDAMIIIDQRGRIEAMSSTAERLFGFALDEVAGRNVSMFMPSPHREQHDGYLDRYLATGERRIIGIGRIVAGQRKDGTTFPMHLTIGEMRSADKHYFTGFIRDLTDQQMTESRLKELQSEVTHMSRFTALGEMASTLAHEINQPLTAINNYLRGSNRILDKAQGDHVPLLREALGNAAGQAMRAGQIIRRLREFVARGDSDRHVENLPKLIEDASTLALIGAKENDIAVSFRLDPQAELVLVDRIQVQQVLVNLIRNAIDVLTEFSGPRRLEVTTRSLEAGYIEMSVSDSGPGLAPLVSEQLFQPFVTTKPKGMGLGLSICRTIVEAHGGRIWVDSRPGEGASFHFTLRKPNAEELSLAQ